MGYQKNTDLSFVYEYDFDVDGGAVSNIPLRALGSALEAGLIVKNMTVYFDTELTSAGSATVTFGNEDDRDGYFVDVFGAYSAGQAVGVGQVDGALLWDSTNDTNLSYPIPDAGAAVPSLTVGTAALTAGKATVVFNCLRF